jgi:hypothetical protein
MARTCRATGERNNPAVDLEAQLNAWMDEHEAELLDLLDDEMERFRAHHPGFDESVAQNNALMMANRRFIARAIGAVLPAWVDHRPQTTDHGRTSAK